MTVLCGILAVLLCALLSYSCVMQRTVRRADARADRDPATGVIRGLEAATISPPPGASSATLHTACLLVHGFVGSRRDFNDLGEELARRGLTVRMMRLPGHGTSPADFARLPPGALLEAVRREFRDLRAQYAAVDVVGFSMGGALSALLAAEEPVDRLVLVAPYYRVRYFWFYLLPPETWNALVGRMVRYVPKWQRFVQVNDRSMAANIFTYDALPTAGVRQLIALGKTARRRDVLGKLKCPVLVVHSSGDVAASFRASCQAFELIGSPRKEGLWLTRSNHHVFWDYDREEVKQRIAAFLVPAATCETARAAAAETNAR